MDPEEFYDFTALRPQVRLRGELTREIIWPVNRFLAAPMGGAHDVIILSGIEPHLRWRTFCECVTTVATEMGVRAAFTLGAMLADHGLTHVAFAPYWQAAKAADPKRPQRAVLPLEGPGLGVEVDEDYIRAHPITEGPAWH